MKTLNQIKRISLWAFVVLAFSAGASFAANNIDMSDGAILERIKPVGKVTLSEGSAAAADEATATADGEATDTAASDAGAATGRSGGDIVKAACQMCHVPGVAGAPKIGDNAAWSARAEKGMDGMMQIAISGLNAMPPRGSCADCSDDELKAAIEHMLSQSGL